MSGKELETLGTCRGVGLTGLMTCDLHSSCDVASEGKVAAAESRRLHDRSDAEAELRFAL